VTLVGSHSKIILVDDTVKASQKALKTESKQASK